jgi:tight adherence protein B
MSTTTLVIILASLFAVILLGAVLMRSFGSLIFKDEVSERLGMYAALPGQSNRREAGRRKVRLSRLRYQVNSMLSAMSSTELNIQLLTANWPITETEFLLIRFAITFLGLVIGWLLFRSPISGIGLAILAYLVPAIYLRNSITRRRVAFERQLIDVLVLMSGAVRSGYSLQQALDAVAREMHSPASEEFRRVIYEVGLGLPISQALNNLSTRMQNSDLYLVITAININYQVGGNLVNMLEAVTKTIRERIRLFGEIRTLTSQQRFNSYILTLMPIGIAAIMFILNPAYISVVFKPSIWLCFPIGAVIFLIIGNIVIRRISKIDV